jgi:hypothetical protein
MRGPAPLELCKSCSVGGAIPTQTEATMGVGKGALLWLIGIPIPIIILLMLFWR